MTHDQVAIVLDHRRVVGRRRAWSAGVAGLARPPRLGALADGRRRDASPCWPWSPARSRTARAMFLSEHDLGVVGLVAAVAGVVALRASRSRVGAALARWSRRPAASERARFGDERRVRRVGRDAVRRSSPQLVGRAAPDQRSKLAESRDRELRPGAVAARAGLVGLPRPAHAAGRPARDDRGARGRPGRRPGALPRADARRGRPDGADGRRPLRAVPDPRRRAAPEPAAGRARRPGQRGARRRRLGRPGARRTARTERSSRTCSSPPTPPSLSRVVSNLLMNAIRHTPADGVVEIQRPGRAGRRRAVGHRRRAAG